MDLDFFKQYLIHFIVLCVTVIGLIYVRYKTLVTKNIPPGRKGLPFIGETWDYIMAARRGTPAKFITDRMSKYSSDIFRTSLLGEDMVVLCGASGNKVLFSGYDKYIISWWPYTFKKILMDPSGVGNSANDEAAKMRSFLPQFLKPDSLKSYIPVMDSVAKEHLQKEWSLCKEVKVFALSKKYTFALGCRLFVSVDDPKYVAKLAEPFAQVMAGLFSLPINLPGTPYNRAVKAGRRIREELKALITSRKMELSTEDNNHNHNSKNPGGKMDLLTNMILDGLDATEISNKIGGFFIANHDSASAAITFIISYLADYPDVYRKVFQEQMEILKAKGEREYLNWQDVEMMKYSWCMACEVLRLLPPASGTFREAIQDFTYAGYTIPKGWKACWNVYTTHNNPKYFPEPEKFDPSRFEGNGPPPFTFVPFGGGPRMCPGKEYARLQILVFMHNIITKFKWKKLIPDEEIKFIGSPFPAKGLPVSLETIQI
ncbi:hypothetical protein JRO89_XS07G0267300 [Xanthoceras sorbifolium]|uniref:Cytochrome P450 n=1 Tax=Xanthoceras sorbifolium TaxID=99658 RepID=A0ABQ8HVG4_9ROSI|nr:hypothetical protein JRO89_XS07G0267300 [Xanthoceras sorbifolium]